MWFLALCPKWFTLFPLQTASLLTLEFWKESWDFSLTGNKVWSCWGKQAYCCYLIHLKSAVWNLLPFHYCVSVLYCEKGEIPSLLQLLQRQTWSNSTKGLPGSRNSGQVTLESVMTLASTVSSSDMVVALKLWPVFPFWEKKTQTKQNQPADPFQRPGQLLCLSFKFSISAFLLGQCLEPLKK